ncbi:hypothetical protein C0W36_06975 [Photobacterium angustum]|uniref:Uncharacterized protein n=1 Tax=Photobacterium angustum TaxID=661 RepID=A0A855SDE7_PHOAN|nr:hypothetical protein UA35_21180 [Photobacterium angustum]KJG44472.1 hypothetical protein UA30_21225 [Photobacterium angustum]KJG50317.1 hypothetical protein UA34_21135 [Photobacterium angustum]PSX07682.1 hypothetical protein C0W41_10575 [Photobacterium angustum]PSX15450.1 hypothetical protein C0W55_05675 [Photobacterium angustum]
MLRLFGVSLNEKKIAIKRCNYLFSLLLLLQIYFNATFYSIIFITNVLTSRHMVAFFDVYVNIALLDQWFVFFVSFLKILILKLNAKKIARFGF